MPVQILSGQVWVNDNEEVNDGIKTNNIDKSG